MQHLNWTAYFFFLNRNELNDSSKTNRQTDPNHELQCTSAWLLQATFNKFGTIVIFVNNATFGKLNFLAWPTSILNLLHMLHSLYAEKRNIYTVSQKMTHFINCYNWLNLLTDLETFLHVILVIFQLLRTTFRFCRSCWWFSATLSRST